MKHKITHLILAGLFGTTIASYAGTFTWDGGGADGFWSTADNWAGNTAPVEADGWHTFVFDTSNQLNSNLDITPGNNGFNINDITFASGAGAFTLSGSSIDMLGAASSGAADGIADITNNSANTQTINNNLIHHTQHNTGLTFNNTNGGAIVVNGVISQLNNQADDVTIQGNGTVTFNGANTYTQDTTISGGTLKIGGAGKLQTGATGFYSGDIAIASGATFQYSSSASNTAARYNGTISGDGTLIKDGSTSILRLQGTTSVANIEINQGTLRVQGNADALGGAGTTVTIGASGSENAILQYTGSNVTYTTKAGIVVGSGSSGTKTILNGGTDNVENTAITLNDNVTIDDSVSFTLGGVISGSGGLTKTNSGTTTLTGANTYSGTTTVSAGTLQISGAGSLSTSSAVVNNANLIYGTTTASDTYGLSSSTTGTGSLTGTAQLMQLNGDITQGTVNLTSGTSGNTYQRGIELVSDTTITAGSITLTGDLGHRNSSTDNLTLDTSATNGAINLDVSIGRSGDWFGFTSFTADAGTGNLTVSGANAGSGGWRGTSSVSLTGNLDISSSFSLSGTGAGKLDLTATGNSSVTGDLALANTTNTWTVNPGLTMDVSGAISGTSAAINKEGTGTLNLTGANTYSGNTSVSGGTLALSAADNNIASSASIDVASGAILDVSGITNGFALTSGQTLSGAGTVTGAMTITSGSVLSPGNSPGTLSTGNQIWSTGGTYHWEINDSGGTKGGNPGWDWLDITGSLDLSNLTPGGFTIDIDSLNSFDLAGTADGFDTWTKGAPGDFDYSFTIATFDSLIGTFDASLFTLDSSGFTNGPSWDWQIKLSDNDLVLEAYAVPEPSSAALLGLGGLALMLRRKRS